MRMKRYLYTSVLTGGMAFLLTSCGGYKEAAEAFQEDDDFRDQAYTQIATNENYFNEFLEEVHDNEQAQLWLLKDHLDHMENGNIQTLVDGNPELKQRMKSIMESKLRENPQLCKVVQDELMDDEEFRMLVVKEVEADLANNPELMDAMIDRLMEDPDKFKVVLQRMLDNEEAKLMIRQEMEDYEKEMKNYSSKDGN